MVTAGGGLIPTWLEGEEGHGVPMEKGQKSKAETVSHSPEALCSLEGQLRLSLAGSGGCTSFSISKFHCDPLRLQLSLTEPESSASQLSCRL